MASDQEVSLGYHDTEDEDDEEDDQEEELEPFEECKPAYTKHGRPHGWSLGRVFGPRAPWVQEWNRVFHLVCATSLFVDPLFFYTLSISDTCMCVFVDGWFAVTVTILRCMTDALHVWNMWLQFKMNKLSYAVGGNEPSAVHNNKSARTVALRYLKAKKGFFFDLFVILPLPQVRSIQVVDS